MTDALQFRDTENMLGTICEIPVLAGAQIVGGTLIAFDKERGGCVSAAGRRGLIAAGVSLQDVNNMQGATGSKMVMAHRRGRFLFDLVTAPTPADLFKRVYAADNQTVETDALGPDGPWVGNLVALVKPGEARGWIEIDGAVLEGRRT